jgi:hypothetical protein
MDGTPVVLNFGNRIGQDWEETPETLARWFWESDRGKEWLTEPGIRLCRVVMAWLSCDLGSGWKPEDWERIEDAVLDRMPRT